MKKILSLLLVGIMLFSLCGCFDGTEPEDVRGELITSDSSTTSSEPEFSLGKTANNVYKNDFLGLSCTLPDDWTFYSDEQILELNNLALDVVGDDLAERLEQANIVYDMYATNQTTGSNMNVNLEKHTAVQMAALNIKQALEAQISDIKTGYINMGYTDINVEYKKTTVDGKQLDSLCITAKIQGLDFYGTVFAFKKGNYLANVTLCSLITDKTDTILGYFDFV